MPTPPYATVLATVNAGPNVSGAIVAAAGDTIQLKLESTDAVDSVRWELFDFPLGWAGPAAGWLTDANGVFYSLDILPDAFDLDADWGKTFARATVNGGLLDGSTNAVLTDEATAFSVLSTDGVEDVGHQETTQFSATQAWVLALRTNLRLLQTALAGGGGAVSSVFARTGAVVAVLNDYAASLVNNDSGVTGATAKDALDTLKAADVTKPTNPTHDGWMAQGSAGDLAYNSAVRVGSSVLGFFNTTPITKPTLTGSGPLAAIASIIAKLVALGLVTDSTTDVSGVAVESLSALYKVDSPGVSTASGANWETIGGFILAAGWAANTVSLDLFAQTLNGDGIGEFRLVDTGLDASGAGTISLSLVTGSTLAIGSIVSPDVFSTGDISANLTADTTYAVQAEMHTDATGADELDLFFAKLVST